MFGGDGALEAIASQYGATTSSNSSSSTEQGVGDDNGASRSSATSAPLSPSASSAAVFEAHGPLHREVGIVPRVLVDLMGVLDLMKGSVDATVLVNYVEVRKKSRQRSRKKKKKQKKKQKKKKQRSGVSRDQETNYAS